MWTGIGIPLISAIIGGLCTLIGVIIANYYNNKTQKSLRLQEKKDKLIGAYLILLAKADLIVRIINSYNSQNDKKGSEYGTCVFSEEESDFLYERLDAFVIILSNDESREIVAFISSLKQFEASRRECIEAANAPITGDVNYDYINSLSIYEKCLCNLLSQLKGELESDIGIKNILIKLESFLEME